MSSARTFLLCSCLCLFGLRAILPAAGADSVVVFNEVMYHPVDGGEMLEWVELYNQLAVDVDLSRWTLAGGIEFQFPEQTVIPGRSFLVIAATPGELATATGLTNVLGPFSGRLANAGERLELRNNDSRLMDRLDYGADDPWPAAADGSGVSLAKRDEEQATAPPENWTVSALRGGTPGRRNFALKPFEVVPTLAMPLTNTWKYDLSGADLGTDWRQPGFNDTLWVAAPALFQAGQGSPPPGNVEPIVTLFSTGLGADGKLLAAGTPDPHYWLTQSAHGQPPPPPIPATVIQNHPAWLANGPASSWLGPVNPGTTDVAAGAYHYATEFDLSEYDAASANLTFLVGVDNTLQDVLLNGVSRGIGHSGFSAWSQEFSLPDGFGPGINRLEFLTINEGGGPNPAGFRLQLSGTARRQMQANTGLPSAPVTSYFRSSFVLPGAPRHSALLLRTVIADGAVFYLNGVEVLRLNLPPGPVAAATLARTNVTTAVYHGPLTLPAAALIAGTNLLAVEVHSSSAPSNDLLFAAELALQTTNLLVPPPFPLAFNELDSATNADFGLELINHGPDPLDLAGVTLSRRGSPTPRDYTFPSQLLAPGACLWVSRSTLGFSADPGDRLFLYPPGGESTADAVVAKAAPRARHPDGGGAWLYPADLTPGESNRFELRSDVVFNEILYHPPPLPAAPEEVLAETWVGFGQRWRYHSLGQDLGTAWRQPRYSDAAWPEGPAVFYHTSSTLPAAKGTQVPLLANGTPILTYYFRTTFVAPTNRAEVNLRPLVDDGAVYYLNGLEIFRQNMPSGLVSYATLASAGVATADISGPFSLLLTNLVVGTNSLAVEVHQFTTNPIAADVVFGLELLATTLTSPPQPARESPGAFVELLNRGPEPVNLQGWSINGDITAQFDAPTTLPPGAFLVVPANPAYMASNYPALNLGPAYAGNLSRRSGFLSLRDAFGNPVNELRYFDGGRWPEYADGGGASLELRDPRADNSRPESWSASAPPTLGWSNYTYRAVARNLPGPTLWHEFVIGLLEAGECLIDDLSVVESPATAPVQMLQNGSFESGLTAWRPLGNHGASRVIDDPHQPGNKVLHLVATGPTGHLHNHLETTLAGGRSVVVGREYQVSFRAKWLAGNHRLNTRLYFNRVARTTPLNRPLAFGTPGATNSRFIPNAGPTFANLRHLPVLPSPNDSIAVSVDASDPDGLGPVAVRWRTDGGQWQSTPMTSTGPAGPPGVGPFTGIIPPQPAGRLVQFYVEAADARGAVALYPAAGSASRALFKVDDGKPRMPQLHTLRLWMTAADVALLHAPTNVMSDDHLRLTVVYNDRQVYYDAGIHLQASQRGRNDSSRVGFRLRFGADDLFRGVQNSLVMDRSGGLSGLGGKHEEILLWHAVNHAGGILGLDCDLVQVFAPRSQDDSTALLRMSAFDNNYFDNLLPNGDEGERYAFELVYYPLTSLNNDPQAPKLPQPDEVINNEIQDGGADPENYRWTWLQENRAEQDDYRRLVALNQAFSLPASALPGRIQQHINVDQWMRTLAFKAFTGDPDTFTYGLNHNWSIYFPPGQGPALGLLWDMDLSFHFPTDVGFPGTGSATTYRIITLPDSFRRYYHHLQDIALLTMNAAHIGPWAKRYGDLLGQDWSRLADYLQARSSYILSRMPPNVPFALTSNGGRGFATNSPVALLAGTAPLNLQSIRVNGLEAALTWSSFSNWTFAVPLPAYSNYFVLQGLDGRGQTLPNAAVSLIVTNLGLLPLKPVVINEWMADNAGPGGFADPLDAGFADWFELYNPNLAPVDLSGYYLTDSLAAPTRWMIPSGTTITSGGFLLVWADGQPEQSGAGSWGDLHADFQLSRGGEAIALFNPAGVLQHSVVFGPQTQNVSQGLFPDGEGTTFYGFEDWTPRGPNRLGAPPSPEILACEVTPAGQVTLGCSVVPHRTYRVEFKNALTDPEWLVIDGHFTASSPLLTIEDQAAADTGRFYRLLLLK